jgi:hypothetical protein
MEASIIAVIAVNTVLLAVEHPAILCSQELLTYFMVAEFLFAAIYSIEMCIRIYAMGFYGKADENTYLRNPWNALDFLIVLSSWLNTVVLLTGAELGIKLSTLRVFRALRVMKMFKMFSGIRTILGTIAKALPPSINVIGFLGFLFIVSGIVGLQLFRGAGLHRCDYGGFQLQQMIAESKERGGPAIVWPRAASDPTYEYPIGIGVWYGYCRLDSDCPLYDAPAPWNRTQTCQPSLNPGRGFQHFDSIFDSWLALYINMANLYWWETAHRIADSNSGIGCTTLAPRASLLICFCSCYCT